MTVSKLFSRTLSPLRIISAFALVASAGIAAMLLWAPRSVRADNAPDWLRAAAQDKLPDYPADTVAVILLDERQTIVKDNGEIETRYRRAYKLLRPEARKEYGGVAVNFDNETKLSFLKAWTVMPDGRQIEVKEKDAVEVGVSDFELYSDAHYKYLKFPEANPGSVVGYEYVQKHRPFVFEDDWSFQDPVPCRRARFSLQIPPGWEFTNHWANFAEQKPQSSSNNQYVWELLDVPAIEIEPEMPAMYAVAGRMDVKYFARDPKMRARTTGTWNDLGIWFGGLTSASRLPSAAIQQKVTELTAGLTDPVAKMRAVTSYAQHQIRYVAIEIGIGGFQPHAASDVFTHQYGDCKDKATLLSSMLHEIGIDSYYVLLETRRGEVNPDFPSTRFNHAILAIRVPDNIKDASLYAVVDHPKLGRLLFFDPTNSVVPLGYLPSYLQDNLGLVVTPDGGTLVSLPLLAPATNRLLRTAQLTLSPTGNLSGEVQELRSGGPADDTREEYLHVAPTDRQKVIERFLAASLGNFTLTAASLTNLDQYDESLTLQYKFVVTGYAKSAGNLLIVRPRVVGGKGSSLLTGKPRKYPIEFEEATRQDDAFDITLPAGYVVDELPKPVLAECAYGTYKSEVQVADNILHYKRTYEIRDVVVPTQKLDEVRDFFHQIAADEKSSAVLRRANP
jgi:transglutaminase-like putative cysteine protease